MAGIIYKNQFDEAHSKAMDEFTERLGLFGNKLQTEKELEENRKRGGGGTIHFWMSCLSIKRFPLILSQFEVYFQIIQIVP